MLTRDVLRHVLFTDRKYRLELHALSLQRPCDSPTFGLRMLSFSAWRRFSNKGGARQEARMPQDI